MEMKFCITLLIVWHMEDNTKIYVMIISLLFFQLLPLPLRKRQSNVLKITVQAGFTLGCYSCRYTIYTYTQSQLWACVFVYIPTDSFLFISFSLYIHTCTGVYMLSIHSGRGIYGYLFTWFGMKEEVYWNQWNCIEYSCWVCHTCAHMQYKQFKLSPHIPYMWYTYEPLNTY